MTTSLNMKIDAELKERLRDLAKQDGRSLAGYIHKVLSDHNKETAKAIKLLRERGSFDPVWAGTQDPEDMG